MADTKSGWMLDNWLSRILLSVAKDQACRGDSEEPEPRCQGGCLCRHQGKELRWFCPQMSQDRPWGAGDGNDKALHREELPGNAV